MINYLASFVNTDGASFPDTLGKNATGPAATDGTEFVKLFIDDLWGARQALMDYSGLTPDSVTEAPDTAQVLEAWRRAFGGPGEVVQYMKNDDPSVNGDRILLLNGQGVLRASFPLLDAATYVGDGDNASASAFFRADDAAGTSRNIVGIYIILPETRGYVPRGLDLAASVDPEGASRDLGNNQADATQTTTGEWEAQAGIGGLRPVNITTGVFKEGAVVGTTFNTATQAGSHNVAFDNSGSVSPNAAKTDDVESRGANYATTFGIRY